ncbi:MAG: hypothetical protein RRY26_12165 [Cellulosilyticaceae bacterium]
MQAFYFGKEQIAKEHCYLFFKLKFEMERYLHELEDNFNPLTQLE